MAAAHSKAASSQRRKASEVAAVRRRETGDEPDGRRRRGKTSRALIVDALLALVRDGEVSPGAARVAELAGVSLRTVYRHFDEMDSLYQEIAESMQARVLPAMFQPYRSEDWKGRMHELIERRIELYEAIFPFKISGDLKRFQSDYLMSDYTQHLLLEKMSLESVLPRDAADDSVLAHSIRAATGFQAWRILRKDLDLDVAASRASLLRTVEALLAARDGK